MLKQLVHNYHVRVIALSDGVDTDRPGWEVIATVMSMMHEKYIHDLAENVIRGLEGVLLAGHSVGDLRFGYRRHFRGEFVLRSIVVADYLDGSEQQTDEPVQVDEIEERVFIDFKKLTKSEAAEEEVMKLFHQNLPCSEIAKELRMSRGTPANFIRS